MKNLYLLFFTLLIPTYALADDTSSDKVLDRWREIQQERRDIEEGRIKNEVSPREEGVYPDDPLEKLRVLQKERIEREQDASGNSAGFGGNPMPKVKKLTYAECMRRQEKTLKGKGIESLDVDNSEADPLTRWRIKNAREICKSASVQKRK